MGVFCKKQGRKAVAFGDAGINLLVWHREEGEEKAVFQRTDFFGIVVDQAAFLF